jgi:CRP-like cAMP-binding protein
MEASHLYLFRDLPEIIRVAEDEVLFKRGEPAHHMYVVIEGAIELRIGSSVVETAHPGAFVGELALIDNAPRSATAVARAGTRVFPIDQDKFRGLVQQTPAFALEVMRSMADRLRRANARIQAPKAAGGTKARAPAAGRRQGSKIAARRAKR